MRIRIPAPSSSCEHTGPVGHVDAQLLEGAGITQALGAERINIEDFELHHMSPDRGGTLTLLITGEDEARRAAELLGAQGYGVVVAPVLGEQ